MADRDTIYVATESFTTNLDGENVIVQKGKTRVRGGHKLLKGREAFFEPLFIQYDVEQATASPGETRKAVKKAKAEPVAEPVVTEEEKPAETAENAESDE